MAVRKTIEGFEFIFNVLFLYYKISYYKDFSSPRFHFPEFEMCCSSDVLFWYQLQWELKSLFLFNDENILNKFYLNCLFYLSFLLSVFLFFYFFFINFLQQSLHISFRFLRCYLAFIAVVIVVQMPDNSFRSFFKRI